MVSVKLFHWPTAQKMHSVARIGVISGIITEINTRVYPAPSRVALSSRDGGRASINVFTRITLYGETSPGITYTQKLSRNPSIRRFMYHGIRPAEKYIVIMISRYQSFRSHISCFVQR